MQCRQKALQTSPLDVGNMVFSIRSLTNTFKNNISLFHLYCDIIILLVQLLINSFISISIGTLLWMAHYAVNTGGSKDE